LAVVVVRSGGVGRGVVMVVVVGVVTGVVVVVVLEAAELLLLLLVVGRVCRLVVVSGQRLVASVADGVVVSTIWNVTNLLDAVVVSMRCSRTGRVVNTGRWVVVRRRSGFRVVNSEDDTLGFSVVRTTKCEFLWVVCALAGRLVVLSG